MNCCTYSGVSRSAPGAFLSGANTSASAIFDDERILGMRQQIEDKPLELERVWLRRVRRG